MINRIMVCLAVFMMALLVFVLGALVGVAVTAQPYGSAATKNAGYVVNLPAPLHCAGWETRGYPGPFINVDC